MYLDETGGTGPLLEGDEGSNRRDFLKVCLMAGAAVGLPAALSEQMAEAAVKGVKPSVIWLHFQECTGCTESLLRTSHPDLAELILDLVSLDYHETLFAAAGHQAEAALKKTMKEHEGKYVCIVEGAIPTKENGIYCQIGGRTAVDILNDVAAKAGAIIAIGSCGAPMVLKGKTVVTIPGCPANPYNLLGTVLQFATLGTLPALDEKGRPKFAYGRTIHEHCPRRAHFDAGRFVQKFGDEGHRQGWCLYKTGCKGPATHANCSVQPFAEVPDAWPIGIGHPCFGCTEQALGFRAPLHDTVDIDRATPPDTYAPLHAPMGKIAPLATGVAGHVGGALLGAAWAASKKLGASDEAEEPRKEA